MTDQARLAKSRRQWLARSLGIGAMALAAPAAKVLAQSSFPRTPDQDVGPFYPVIKPVDQDADLTVIQGRAGRAQGQVMYLTGRVLNTKGQPLTGARVEIWQANTHGRYTHPSDQNTAPLDENFDGYAVQMTDAEGRYRFKTIKPGSYPVPALAIRRPPHIHFDVTARTERLVTQMYFPGEPLNAQDQLLQRSLGRKDSLLASLQASTPDLEPGSIVMAWDVILPRG